MYHFSLRHLIVLALFAIGLYAIIRAMPPNDKDSHA
jgi:hypothetical protein